MKLKFSTVLLGKDLKPLKDKEAYVVAKEIEENGVKKLIPVTTDEGVLKVVKEGEDITVGKKITDYLLSQNKENAQAKSKLGWKILMAGDKADEIDIAETDKDMIRALVLEKETDGLYLHPILNVIDNPITEKAKK